MSRARRSIAAYLSPLDAYAARILASGPLAYWRMGEATGPARDRSGHGHDLALSGTLTRQVAAVPPLVDDRAMTLGVDGEGRQTGGPWEFAGRASYTLALWWTGGLPTSGATLIGTDVTYLWWETDPLRIIAERWYGWSARDDVAILVDPARLSSPLHLAMTYDGSTLALYVDTERAATVATTDLPGGSSTLYVGHYDGDYHAPGTYDEIVVFDDALDHQTIADHYVAGAGWRCGAWGAGAWGVGPWGRCAPITTPIGAGQVTADAIAALDRLRAAHPLSGHVVAHDDATAHLSVGHVVAGDAATDAAAIAHLRVGHVVAGDAAADAAAIAHIRLGHVVAGDATGDALTRIAIRVAHRITGETTTTAQTTTSIRLGHVVAGDAAADALAALDRLRAAHPLSGQVVAHDDATAHLRVGHGVAGDAVADSLAVLSRLLIGESWIATIVGDALTTGRLRVGHIVAGDATGDALTRILTIAAGDRLTGHAATDALTTLDRLRTASALTGRAVDQAAATGHLRLRHAITGMSTADAAAAATLDAIPAIIIVDLRADRPPITIDAGRATAAVAAASTRDTIDIWRHDALIRALRDDMLVSRGRG